MFALKRLHFLFVLLLLTTSVYAEFDVHILYFKPTDASDIDKDYHDVILKDIQQYFQIEMTRLGYTDKTFPLELDENNKVVIHTINGKHKTAHYDIHDKYDTAQKSFTQYKNTIEPELPFRFHTVKNLPARNNAHLIIIGGIKDPAPAMGFTFLGGNHGGIATVSMDIKNVLPNHYLGIVAHELGHAFGLDPNHNNHNGGASFNGTVIAWGKTTNEWGERMRLIEEDGVVLNNRSIFRRMDLTQPVKVNKNPDLGLGVDQSDKDKGDPISINPRNKLTIKWGKLKKRR